MHCHCRIAFVSASQSGTNKSSRVRSNLRWCYSRWSPVLSRSLTQAASCTDSLRWSWRFRCGSRTYHSPHATRWYWTEGLDTTLTRASLLRAGRTSCRCSSNSMADIIQGWKCIVHAMSTLEENILAWQGKQRFVKQQDYQTGDNMLTSLQKVAKITLQYNKNIPV
jgi:hypothetical protein